MANIKFSGIIGAQILGECARMVTA
jgi:hypothetical protein